MKKIDYNKSNSQLAHLLKLKTVAEFFAGIGLMRMGLEKQGWNVIFANDIAKEKYEMYSVQFPNTSTDFVLDDIHALEENKVPSVSLATASFPCNDLSLAGLRKGLAGKQSSAYWGFINILEKMRSRRPPIVLLENVAGFLTSHKGKDFSDAMLALNRLGYVVDPFIIDAANFVPQSRVRLFVVAHLKCQECSHESRGFYESEIRPKALADFIFDHPEINWEIKSLPALPKRSLLLDDIIEDIPDDSDIWWNEERQVYLVNQMSEKHARNLKSLQIKKKWSYSTAFRRVRNGNSMAEIRSDGVAGCLRTPRGGSGRQILIKAGYGKIKVRLLTPSECARLMGADGFQIKTTLNKALFGFGDAVCVPVISWIAKYYLDPLVNEMAATASKNE
ncbi:MAG TPA: DNA cytosine methyltransferase [bacterium]|nr:DNA cytosine methyltransferase [bacterium]HPN36232.1 DNA cytosine methyltransferase [bacterium]